MRSTTARPAIPRWPGTPSLQGSMGIKHMGRTMPQVSVTTLTPDSWPSWLSRAIALEGRQASDAGIAPRDSNPIESCTILV